MTDSRPVVSDPRPVPDTRDRILDAAVELFHRQGYADTSIAQIRDEAGVSSSSLYHFYPTKDALLMAVLDQYHDVIGPAILNEAFRGIDDPHERLFSLLGRYRGMLTATDFRYGCPIGNLALEVGPHHPEARSRVLACFNRWINAVAEVLAELPDPPAAPRDTASFMLTVLEGAILQSISQHDLAPFDIAMAHLEQYLTGLRHHPGTALENTA